VDVAIVVVSTDSVNGVVSLDEQPAANSIKLITAA
jgi:hypothetical protein